MGIARVGSVASQRGAISVGVKRQVTDFVTDSRGVSHYIKSTLNRIKSGLRFPHKNDGSVFYNRQNLLPAKPKGYYREYVHPTPGLTGPGPNRIVIGDGGEMYLTLDHYLSFIPIN